MSAMQRHEANSTQLHIKVNEQTQLITRVIMRPTLDPEAQ